MMSKDQPEEEKEQEKTGAKHKGKTLNKQESVEQKNKKQFQLLGQQEEESLVSETFADPTYDSTFKMLFGQNSHKNILISFLNSLLNFEGKDRIKELTVINSDLIQEDVKAIESAVDVRCRTESGEDISIEMQRRSEDYFLARTQDYMAKLVSSQTMKHDSNKYHLVMSKTYIVVVSKAQLFLKENKIVGDTNIMYEKTVVPMIKELNQEIPHNKMCWKFFELPKFISAAKNISVDQNSPLKIQWLHFLTSCNKQNEIPEDADDIIKEGYNIMKIANWGKEQRDNYELSKINEAYLLQELEDKEKQGFDKGLKMGELKGKIKGEIDKVKALLENEVPQDKIIPKLKFLPHDSIEYINQHMDDSASQVFNDNYQNLIGDVHMEQL